ncbi:lysosomal acid lipase/cholesteryl ester hydrolase-like isoform X1 [Dermacentor albipictus]|uniref:lysosomal acid lipase/cholesteryl ester hydrolase-like isoform X1 n=2 Tax=Dermacentor albipictus TaxID=60249 RepID=UPI0031FC839B
MVAVAQVVPGLIVSSIGLALNFTARLMKNNANDPDVCTTIETLVRSKGYPFETHEVATGDGYLLQLHRIRHGRDGHCGANETGGACCGRGPVFVMTGLLADSASIVLDFPKQSLGYVLADNGYDVWLGNVRGNTYGKKHKNLDVKSKKFWNFSFHEHAIFDVPAQVDYILKETKHKDLLYIGISQGTLTFFTMLAEKPWYNDRIKAFAGLAPFFKLAHLKVPPLAVFSPYGEAPLRLVHAAGGYEVLPQGMPIAGFVRQFCGYATRGICSLLADNFANFGSRYVNESRIPVYLCHMPAGTSMKNIIHYNQLVISKKFQKFDYGAFYNKDYYGKRSVPEYELSNVQTDLGIFWSAGDEFVPPEDVRELLASLQRHVKKSYYIDDPFYTHVHFVVSTTNGIYLHKELLGFLARYGGKGELCPAA